MSGPPGGLTVIRPQFQPFPNLDAPVVNNNLTVSVPWYQFFVTLWQRDGLGNGVPANAVNLTNLTPGGTQEPQTLEASPFDLLTGVVGQLLVTRKYTIVPATGVFTREAGGETVEFSRNGGTTWFLAGHAPLLLPLAAGDMARVSWRTAGPPIVIFFPATS